MWQRGIVPWPSGDHDEQKMMWRSRYTTVYLHAIQIWIHKSAAQLLSACNRHCWTSRPDCPGMHKSPWTLQHSFPRHFPIEATQRRQVPLFHGPVWPCNGLRPHTVFRKGAGWKKIFASLRWHFYVFATRRPPGHISFQESHSSRLWKSMWT